jgi:hypothetical protein
MFGGRFSVGSKFETKSSTPSISLDIDTPNIHA